MLKNVLYVLLASLTLNSFWALANVHQFDVCASERVEVTTQNNWGLDPTDFKILEIENFCSDDRFCFKIQVQSEIEASGYRVPSGSSIRYCTREGLKYIQKKDGILSSKSLSCKDEIRFEGMDENVCSCTLAKSKSLSIKTNGAVLDVSLPPKTVVSTSKDRVTAFSPSQDIKDCGEGNPPTEEQMALIFERSRIPKSSLKSVSLSDSKCFAMSEQIGSEVFAIAKKEIQVEGVKIPPDAGVLFCDGLIESLDTAFPLTVFGYQCDRDLRRDKTQGSDKVRYQCTLAQTYQNKGVKLKKGTKVILSKEGISCLSGPAPNEEEPPQPCPK